MEKILLAMHAYRNLSMVYDLSWSDNTFDRERLHVTRVYCTSVDTMHVDAVNYLLLYRYNIVIFNGAMPNITFHLANNGPYINLYITF